VKLIFYYTVTFAEEDRTFFSVRLEERVVAQLSAIDVAALYHYHIWPEGRYQTLTENRESAIPESEYQESGESSIGNRRVSRSGQMPKQPVSVGESGPDPRST